MEDKKKKDSDGLKFRMKEAKKQEAKDKKAEKK